MIADGVKLELKYAGTPLRLLPFNWCVRGKTISYTVQLVNSDTRAIKNLSLGVASYSSNWRGGSEVVSQKFLSVNSTSLGTYRIGTIQSGASTNLTFSFYIPETYPLDESSDTRHGLIHWKLTFSGYVDEDTNNTFFHDIHLHDRYIDDSRGTNAVTAIDWFMCRAMVLTASEYSDISSFITI